jgi:glycosyltransferase involved in cell wall biosynthesis
MRKYVIANLEENKINYSYFEMVPQIVLNELYNCLDLYIVSSRIEGGPRSIMECGLTKTPIISTDVGIAKLILPDINIYDINDYMTYKKSNPYQSIEQIYKNTEEFSIEKYMEKFVKTIFINM